MGSGAAMRVFPDAAKGIFFSVSHAKTTLYYPIITFQRYLAMPLFAIYNESQSRVSKKAPTQRRFRLSVPFPRIYHLVWFVITENRKFWESLLRYKASPNGITPSSGAAITRSRGDERVLLKHTDGETIGLQTYRFGAEYPTATAAPAAGVNRFLVNRGSESISNPIEVLEKAAHAGNKRGSIELEFLIVG
ncbi:hypothetical protein V1477_001754 [Vespula maculifrons]|uniref:Uncharacterized protein n=1 Tax=Vespula maculifrons TaxID=7453 RepID=A0ABD2CX07_VESMC